MFHSYICRDNPCSRLKCDWPADFPPRSPADQSGQLSSSDAAGGCDWLALARGFLFPLPKAQLADWPPRREPQATPTRAVRKEREGGGGGEMIKVGDQRDLPSSVLHRAGSDWLAPGVGVVTWPGSLFAWLLLPLGLLRHSGRGAARGEEGGGGGRAAARTPPGV